MPERFPLFPVSRQHLEALSTDVGIMQHAQAERPDPEHGYCTDDVARALLVDLLHQRQLGWRAVEASAARNLRFLADAFDDPTGRFRNLRRWDGAWLDIVGSEDAHARALQALAETIRWAPVGPVRSAAAALFERALPSAGRLGSLRPLATVLLACDAAVRAGVSGAVMNVYRRIADDVWRSFATCQNDRRWPWPESVVTYENELPARALIVAGRWFDRPSMVRAGLRALDWLIEAQTGADGRLASVGNVGWWPRDGRAARYDQQAISATSLLLAAETAFEETGAPHYRDAVESAYGWFLGRNDAQAAVADPARGACGDGIGPAGVSRNQGAESTLMWLMALERMRVLRAGMAQPTSVPTDALAVVS